MRSQLLLIAKTPVPGQVKTRLCPPCTPEQAADLAAAAIADTVATLSAVPATRRTVVLSGQMTVPRGWSRVEQHGDGLGHRLANAFADTAMPGTASVLVGMDTPQLRVDLLSAAASLLDDADAVLGHAEDGGWWALGLRDPAAARVLRNVPMSTAETGDRTARALQALALRVAPLPVLRDVDTWADAEAVATSAPQGRFAAVLTAMRPQGTR
ncbi:TIGR04282 family arsenosugar biosynthesis glycosyltransferase [Dactylosporangium sp. CA-152071]|uniref:TIGR04282 family arsenosugar biosynthesis glycosyltransferase n=1 Tax=Dactylosporangium sp. CA-152071 TaxID=3239933 RepID=UPI003D8EF1D5